MAPFPFLFAPAETWLPEVKQCIHVQQLPNNIRVFTALENTLETKLSHGKNR